MSGELHRLLAALAVEPDERMRQQMARWPADVPGFDPVKRPGFYPHKYRAATRVGDDAELLAELRPADDGGWFLALTFQAVGPRRREVMERWIAYRTATTRPAH